MAFDVYVGSFTRYYSGDWENVAQQYARQQGLAYHVVRPGSEGSEPAPKDKVIKLVTEWRKRMAATLPDIGLDWDETATAPYFTDRPHLDGYSSLLIWAAYDEHPELDKPERVPVEAWWENEAFQASIAPAFDTRYPHLLASECWLPSDFDLPFGAVSPTRQPMSFGSSVRLLAELETLNLRTWHEDERAMHEQLDAQPHEEMGLSVAARMGFLVLRTLASKSIEHRLPMLLDY